MEKNFENNIHRNPFKILKECTFYRRINIFISDIKQLVMIKSFKGRLHLFRYLFRFTQNN